MSHDNDQRDWIRILEPDASLFAAMLDIVRVVEADSLGPANSHNLSVIEQLGRNKPEFDGIAAAISMLIEHRGTAKVLVVRTGSKFVKDLPPTPTAHDSQRVFLPLDVVRVALIGAADGFSYAFESQARGNLCDDVMPLPDSHSVRGISHGLEVGWHTEDACFNADTQNLAADVLSIAMLRNQWADPVRVSAPSLDRLAARDRKTLRLPLFRIPRSSAHGLSSLSEPRSILYDNDLMRFSFALGLGNMTSESDFDAAKSLSALAQLVEDSGLSCEAIAGDIIFIDNMRAAHARSSWRVPPSYDGTDRWQRRLGFVARPRIPILMSAAVDGQPRVIDFSRATV